MSVSSFNPARPRPLPLTITPHRTSHHLPSALHSSCLYRHKKQGYLLLSGSVPASNLSSRTSIGTFYPTSSRHLPRTINPTENLVIYILVYTGSRSKSIFPYGAQFQSLASAIIQLSDDTFCPTSFRLLLRTITSTDNSIVSTFESSRFRSLQAKEAKSSS